MCLSGIALHTNVMVTVKNEEGLVCIETRISLRRKHFGKG